MEHLIPVAAVLLLGLLGLRLLLVLAPRADEQPDAIHDPVLADPADGAR